MPIAGLIGGEKHGFLIKFCATEEFFKYVRIPAS